jgi:putative heme iron utilization protein
MAANQEQGFCAAAAGVLVAARAGTLATSVGGIPHAALVTPALNLHGQVVLLLSDLSLHTKQLRQNPNCALLVAAPALDKNPQTAPRLTVSGRAEIVNDTITAQQYLKTHPYAELYYGFGDFHFWKLVLNDAHYVGGFGRAAGLDIAALQHEIMSLLESG